MKKVFMLICLTLLMALLAGLTYGAELDVGLSYLSGTTEKKGLDVSLEAEKGAVSGSARIRYAEQDEAISENRGHLRLGYDPVISQKWSLWFYEQAGYDEMREIDYENFIGGGPKYKFGLRNAECGISLSLGILQHHTRYEDERVTDVARLSLRPKLRWQISDNFSFALVAFYQPNIEHFKDYIITGEAGLRYSLTEKVGLKLKVEDEYRSVSAIEDKNQLTAVLALSVNF